MSNKIYSLWISGPLTDVNLLTIRSFQKHGHEFILYSYDLSVTNECEVRDARLIMPESEIFYYKRMAGGNPNFKFGGIAERLKAEMLFQLGGWHVDLDVTCLKSFDDICFEAFLVKGFYPSLNTIKPVEPEYVLRPHNEGGIVANIIKAPAGSEFARRYLEHTKTIDENNTEWTKSFRGLNQIVKDLKFNVYILPKEVLGDDSDEYYRKFLHVGNVPGIELHAVHWCNARKLDSEKGSYFQSLLKEYNIL
jgi:hypothetical protein